MDTDRFDLAVAEARSKLRPKKCPTCASTGVFTEITEQTDVTASVALHCVVGHVWVISVSIVEAYAMKPEIEAEVPEPSCGPAPGSCRRRGVYRL